MTSILEKFPINTDRFIQNHQVYYKLYEPLFNGKERIYLDDVDGQLQKEFIEYAKQIIDIYTVAKKILVQNDWEQCEDDYMMWRKIKSPKQNIKFIRAIKEYWCHSQANNIDILATYSSVIDTYEYLMRGGKFRIAISRLFGDIVGMSYHRSWTSCMNIGNNSEMPNRIIDDLANGTLIAYLICGDDEDILAPIARTLIKPYKLSHQRQNKILLGVPGTCYGILGYKENGSILSKIVNNYCVEVFNHKLVEQFKFYDLCENKMCTLFGGTYREGITDIDFFELLHDATKSKLCIQLIDNLIMSNVNMSINVFITVFHKLMGYFPVDFFERVIPHIHTNMDELKQLNPTRKQKLKMINKKLNNKLFEALNIDWKSLTQNSNVTTYTVNCYDVNTMIVTDHIYCA